MEIRIIKDIRDFEETIFFGLTMRQFICAVLSVITAVFWYVCLRGILGRETVSWVCIVGAAPVAVAGIFCYNGMTFEKFLWAWLKSSVLLAGKRVWKSENYHTMLLKKEKHRK